jgi:hypothetical protein
MNSAANRAVSSQMVCRAKTTAPLGPHRLVTRDEALAQRRWLAWLRGIPAVRRKQTGQ